MSDISREFKGERRKVRINDVYRGDMGKGIIRIDPDINDQLNLMTGDVIEIFHPVAGKKTVALLYPGKNEDRGSNLIRMDSSLRRNLSASLDDIVEIRKIEAGLAERVTLAGAEESVILRKSEQLVRMLENRVITKGDFLSFNATGRRIDFVVVDFSPKVDAVQIHLNTKITIIEKTYKEVLELERNQVSFEDIGGLDNEIQKLKEIVELPLKRPELFQKMGIEQAKGILLYGQPGTGKTLLVKALRSQTNIHFITIKGSEIMSKFYGQSEENLRKLFEEAKDMAPSIIYIDRIETIAPKQALYEGIIDIRVASQLLSLMEGIEKRGDITVIGETNDLDSIDPVFRRSGRFDIEMEVKPPDDIGRLEILKIHTRGVPLNEDVDLKVIAEKTHGFVGSELKALVREAALFPIREILPQINLENSVPKELLDTLQIKMEHFLAAIEKLEKV